MQQRFAIAFPTSPNAIALSSHTQTRSHSQHPQTTIAHNPIILSDRSPQHPQTAIAFPISQRPIPTERLRYRTPTPPTSDR
ncbi:hypothetical protein [Anabaena sp. PCC 7108]|uniref:hypothetical protein n=1 Tax=Anabaena sp. PCC 7108 TaxID=163908 RepID=UPI00034D98EA|nr:hypothetical protein [Anabaena sp. PCC 7108]